VVDNSAEVDMWVYEEGRKRCLKKTVLYAKYYSDDERKGSERGGGMFREYKQREMCFGGETYRKGINWKNLGVHGKIILKIICK